MKVCPSCNKSSQSLEQAVSALQEQPQSVPAHRVCAQLQPCSVPGVGGIDLHGLTGHIMSLRHAWASLSWQHQGSPGRAGHSGCKALNVQVLVGSCLANQWIFEPTTNLVLYAHKSMHTEPPAENRGRVCVSLLILYREKPFFGTLELLNSIICAIVLDTALLPFSLQTAIWVIGLYTTHFNSGKTQ